MWKCWESFVPLCVSHASAVSGSVVTPYLLAVPTTDRRAGLAYGFHLLVRKHPSCCRHPIQNHLRWLTSARHFWRRSWPFWKWTAWPRLAATRAPPAGSGPHQELTIAGPAADCVRSSATQSKMGRTKREQNCNRRLAERRAPVGRSRTLTCLSDLPSSVCAERDRCSSGCSCWSAGRRRPQAWHPAPLAASWNAEPTAAAAAAAA